MNGLPDVITTKATTVRSLSSVLERSQTFIVQTYRQRDEGDTIFIEYIGVEGRLRLALPPVAHLLLVVLRREGHRRWPGFSTTAVCACSSALPPGAPTPRPVSSPRTTSTSSVVTGISVSTSRRLRAIERPPTAPSPAWWRRADESHQ